MKVTELVIEYGRTTRPADFESKSCKMEVRVVLEEGEDARKVADQMLKRIQEKVEGTLAEKTPVRGGDMV